MKELKSEAHGLKAFFLLVFSFNFLSFPWKLSQCLNIYHCTYCSLQWIKSLDFKVFVASRVCKNYLLRKYLLTALSGPGFGWCKVITVCLWPCWHPKDLDLRAFLHLISRLKFKMDILLFYHRTLSAKVFFFFLEECMILRANDVSFRVGYNACGLPRWCYGKELACQCRRHGFDPWVWKTPWRRAWQTTPVVLPGESHGQRSWWATVHRVAKSWHNWSDLACTNT